MQYFKRDWNETRGDKYDSWGLSVWYFETNDHGKPVRHMELYENGKLLKYSADHMKDKFGFLARSAIPLKDFQENKIEKNVFFKLWNK